MPGLKEIIRGVARGANRHAEMTGKRGNKDFHPRLGAVKTGRVVAGHFRNIKEMIPEFIVPDLTEFKLLPYVSLKVPDVECEPITAKEVFDVCIAPSVEADFKAGKFNSKQTNVAAAQES